MGPGAPDVFPPPVTTGAGPVDPGSGIHGNVVHADENGRRTGEGGGDGPGGGTGRCTGTDAAIAKVGGVDHVIVVRRTGAAVDMDPVRDVYYDKAAEVVTAECPCEHMNAEDPLFIL